MRILSISSIVIFFISCYCIKPSKVESNHIKRTGRDTLSTYYFIDSITHIEIYGQYLKHQKVGEWKYFSDKRLTLIKYYSDDGKLYFEQTNNINHQNRTETIYLGDNTSRKFYYNSENEIVKEVSTSSSSSFSEKLLIKSTDTSYEFTFKENGKPIYSIIQDRKRMTKRLIVLSEDSIMCDIKF